MIDLSYALERFAVPGGITVIRREPGGYVNGRVGPATEERTVGVEASVQPAGTKDLELLPEGMRSKESKAIWTEFALRVGEADGPLADRVEIDGEIFEVHATENYQAMAGYTKAIAVRVSP